MEGLGRGIGNAGPPHPAPFPRPEHGSERGDEAGQRAALKAFTEDQRFVMSTFVAVEESGLDPCDLRLREGDLAVRELVADAVPMFEFAVRTTLARFDLDTAEGRVRGLRAAAPVVAGIRDRALRREYTRRLAGWVGLPENEAVGAVRAAERRGIRPGLAEEPYGGDLYEEEGAHGTTAGPGLPPVTDPVARLERQALEVLVQMPVVAAEAGADDLDPSAFTQPIHRAVFEAVEAAGGAAEVPGLVDRAQAAGIAPAEATQRATIHWIEEVRAGAIGPVSAAVTELAVAPLPLPVPRGNAAGSGQPDPDAARRYASGVLRALARTGVNRRLAELRARHRRMSPEDEGYREVFEEIVGLENRRQQMAREV